MSIFEGKLGDKKIYFKDRKDITLLEKIEKEEHNILEIYKDDRRTFVAKVEIDTKIYLLKKIFIYKRLKKIASIFKKGEAVDTMTNIYDLRRRGVKNLVDIIACMNTRKGGILTQELMLMEYCEGVKPTTDGDLLEIIEVLRPVYENSRYHGDVNPGNFIKTPDGIKIIDTKLKKMMFGDYRKHYDMLTLGKYFSGEYRYPYPKNLFYIFAYMTRKIRDFKNRVR